MDEENPIKPATFRFAAMTLIAAAAGLLFLGLIWNYLIALFLAAVTAASFFPAFRTMRDKFGGRSGLAAGLIILGLLLFLIGPVMVLAYLLADQASAFADYAAPWIRQQIETQQQNGALVLPDWVPFKDALEDYLSEAFVKIGELSGSISQFVLGLASGITSGIAGFFIGMLIFFYGLYYFLLRGPGLMEHVAVYNEAMGGIHGSIMDRALDVSKATIKGTLVLGVIQGIIGGIGFALFGVPGAILWGTVMVVASFIPMVGTAIIWIPGAVYLAISGETYMAIGFTLYSAIILSNIETVLRPLFVGRSSKLSDLIVLISTLGGLSLFGAAGIILGPVTAAICITVFETYTQSVMSKVKA